MLPIRYTSIDSMRQWTVMADLCQASRPMLRSFPCSVPEEHHPLLGRPDTDHARHCSYEEDSERGGTSNHHFGSSLLWL